MPLAADNKMVADARSSVWLLPNMIDYFRLAILAMVLFSYDEFPQVATLLFILGALLDAVDGSLSRWLKQESKLGQILDMMTDRAYLAVLCIIAIKLYPHYWSWISLILIVDLISHVGLLYGCYLLQRQESHLEFLYQCLGRKKTIGGFLFTLFAKKSWFRFAACFGHDLFLGVFVLHYYINWLPIEPIVWVASPFFVIKTWINVIQLTATIQLTSLE